MNNTACIDMEGVLIPELWPHIAKKAALQELCITTREEPNYEKLMQLRISLLRENNIKLNDVQKILEDIKPLPGALTFINKLSNFLI